MPPSVRHVEAAAAVGVLVGSARRARRQSVSPSEELVFRYFNGAPDSVHAPLWAVMQSGSLAAVLVVSAEQYRRERTRTAIACLVAGTAVWAGVKLVKPTIGRGRPQRHLDDVSVRGSAQSGLGFPSGHAAVATTLALVAFGRSSRTGRAVASVLAGATGGARIYVGAHLPLDVVGGLAIGVLSGRGANAILRWWEQGRGP